jgi:predicted nucleic acid-binding protein
MTKRSFPDVNVWFALAVADHPFHRLALSWWNEESSFAGFCRLTQLFRSQSNLRRASPKVWVNAYLAAHAAANEAMLVTFDQAFTNYGIECLILH